MTPAPTPPISFDAIRLALVTAVINATGLDQNHVIMAEAEVANQPRPGLPYVTLKTITPAARYGDDEGDWVLSPQGQPTPTRVYCGPRAMTTSFHCYARTHEQAYGIMALWQASLEVPDIRIPLHQAGIAVWLIGGIVDLSALLNTGYEGRANMDVKFGLTSQLTLPAQTIGQTTVAGSVDPGSGTPLSITVTAQD